MDLYAYVTLTGPAGKRIGEKMARFIDLLQQISGALPLRTVPLEIQVWGPVAPRLTTARQHALDIQNQAMEAWNTEIEARFAQADRRRPIHEISLRR
ncbi:MAG TPA: hypothetical protein VFQ44_17400 [Streptosporangiaceae bacterium]|nr:hypothetical protein [Streptosporangiaceae bacterium]